MPTNHDDGTDSPPVSPDERKLNLGCGEDYRPAYHNVDIDPTVEVDQRLDLGDTPWPLPADHFEVVLVDNVFEHIEPRYRPAFLQEVRRVLDTDGELIMRLPTRVGWDVTHYAVPTHRWPDHPTHRDDWEILEQNPKKIGPGRLMPDRLALLCTEYEVIRCVSQIEIRVRLG